MTEYREEGTHSHMEEKLYDIAIIGGGIAGFSAALTVRSMKRDFLWIGSSLFGEKLKKSEHMTNYPAFSGDGAAFIDALERQRRLEDIPFTKAHVDAVYAAGEEFLLSASCGTLRSRTVILCTGVDFGSAIKGEKEYLGRGVSYCAMCDGALYRGKKIAVVAASEEFAGEVELLAGFADMVYAFCLYEGAQFSHGNIVCMDGKPLSVEGEGHVERLVTTNGTIGLDGVFLLREAISPGALVRGLKTDGPHVAVQRDLSASIKGLFAAGDVTGLPYQCAKAAGEGLCAAYGAVKYLRLREKNGN